MHWLRSIEATAPSYPAVWLVATPQRPRNLTERSTLRRETARAILARQLGRPAAEIAIAHDSAGRPLLATARETDLQISLATRADVVAIALAQAPVGVDVERVDPAGVIPREALHRDEWRMLEESEPSLRALAFARLWAAKEAYVKALGTGFVRPPESFAILLISPERFRVHDPLRGMAEGALVTIENGGQEILAAAAIVLDGA